MMSSRMGLDDDCNGLNYTLVTSPPPPQGHQLLAYKHCCIGMCDFFHLFKPRIQPNMNEK